MWNWKPACGTAQNAVRAKKCEMRKYLLPAAGFLLPAGQCLVIAELWELPGGDYLGGAVWGVSLIWRDFIFWIRVFR